MHISKTLLIAALFLLSNQVFAQEPEKICPTLTNEITKRILDQVEIGNQDAIKSLPDCLKLNRKLILKAVLIIPSQLQYAADLLKDDQNFIRRLLKADPTVLQYASTNLRSDQYFMEGATYLDRDALQYADPTILDNKLFMRRMIKIDSRNYIYASNRLKELDEFAKAAFDDDGLLLSYAPEKIKNSKPLVRIALKSNHSAIEFASASIKQDKEFAQYLKPKISTVSNKDLGDSLRKNYLVEKEAKNLGFTIGNQAKNFPKHQILNRQYVTKWLGDLRLNDETISKDLHLTTVHDRNYPMLWKDDFKAHPDLIKKIEDFFLRHNLDHRTIDNLSTTYLWKIKNSPETFAFNLYLLRESNDPDFGPEFSNVTSLTAIVQKHKKQWKMTVVEVIFDSEIRTSAGYKNGHKKYVLWDLYKKNKFDSRPKIIFKIEDKFRESFEIFEEQSGGKYITLKKLNFEELHH